MEYRHLIKNPKTRKVWGNGMYCEMGRLMQGTKTGKKAITDYEVVKRFRGFSLLRLRLLTGRTHQLRVHLAYLKHPIVADDMYGGKMVYPWQLKDAESTVEEPVTNRIALHAHTLEFVHPSTEKIVTFEAPLPEDMQQLLSMLRDYRRK